MTNSLSLRKLILNNFRTFAGKHEVNFKENGLVLIKGANGSGKSNLLLGISYLLNFCRLSAKALQRWDTDIMYVEGHFDSPKGPVIIHRGTKATWISINGEKTKGAVKAVEEAIDQLFGCTASIRELLTYRDQIKPYAFLSMTDAQLKEVLTKVLGMEALEAEISDRTEKLKLLQNSASSEEAIVEIRKGEYDSVKVPEVPSPPDLSDFEVCEKGYEHMLPLLVKEMDSLKAKMKSVPDPDASEIDVTKNKILECQKFMDQLKDKYQADVDAYEEEKAKRQASIAAYIRQKDQSGPVAKEKARLEKELVSLEASQCPTCERQWLEAAEKVNKIKETICDYDAKLLKFEAAGEIAAELTKALAEFKDSAPELGPKWFKLSDIKEKLQGEVAAFQSGLKLKKSEALAELQKQLITIQERHSEGVKYLSEAKANIARWKGEYEKEMALFKSMSNAKDTAKFRYDNAVHVFQEATNTFRLESDYLETIRGFRSKVFDEVLDAISDEANTVLANLPNAQAVSIEFKSEKESESGKVKYQIKPMVYIEGQARVPGEVLSGGQLASLNLAVDLAVIKVVSARQGTNPGWIILDEYFHGHDVQTKQSCLDILAEYGRLGLVLVVEHASEFQSFFDSSITVTNVNGASEIKYG